MSLRLAALACALALAGCGDRTPAGYPGYVEGEYVRVGAPLSARCCNSRWSAACRSRRMHRCSRSRASRNARHAPKPKRASARCSPRSPIWRKPGDRRRLRPCARSSRRRRRRCGKARRICFAPRSSLPTSSSRHRSATNRLRRATATALGSPSSTSRCRSPTCRREATRLPQRRPKSKPPATRSPRPSGASRRNRRGHPSRASSWIRCTARRMGSCRRAGRLAAAAGERQDSFLRPEPTVGTLRLGDAVSVHCDGCGADIAAAIRFIAPQAEFTPPVIYSRENRANLVFLVEARPNTPNPALHPGLPVEVALAARAR